MDRKNVILIHGYNGVPPIYQWLKGKLSEKGHEVIIPEFPPREGVIYSRWRDVMNQYQSSFNEDTIVVAHSCGNEFLIKYLCEYNINIKQYIGLAGFAESFECEGKPDLTRVTKDFLVNNEEINKFKELVQSRYAIYSDNDHIVPFTVLENYPKQIEAKPILIKRIGHMGRKSGLQEIPKVWEIMDEH